MKLWGLYWRNEQERHKRYKNARGVILGLNDKNGAHNCLGSGYNNRAAAVIMFDRVYDLFFRYIYFFLEASPGELLFIYLLKNICSAIW